MTDNTKLVTKVASSQAPPTLQINKTCVSPDFKSGECKNIRDCPSVYNEFKQSATDPEFIGYLKNSWAICDYFNGNVSIYSLLFKFKFNYF